MKICTYGKFRIFLESQLYYLFLLYYFRTLKVILSRERYAHKNHSYTYKHEDLNLLSKFMKHS